MYVKRSALDKFLLPDHDAGSPVVILTILKVRAICPEDGNKIHEPITLCEGSHPGASLITTTL